MKTLLAIIILAAPAMAQEYVTKLGVKPEDYLNKSVPTIDVARAKAGGGDLLGQVVKIKFRNVDGSEPLAGKPEWNICRISGETSYAFECLMNPAGNEWASRAIAKNNKSYVVYAYFPKDGVRGQYEHVRFHCVLLGRELRRTSMTEPAKFVW